MYLKKQITANNHYFEIEIDGYHEMQPGRETWIASTSIDSIDVTPQLADLPYMSFYLEQWTDLSADNRFLFLPFEVGAILIDTQTLAKLQLPYCKFRGNKFSDNRLFTYGGYTILITDLTSKYTANYYLHEDMIIDNVAVLSNTELEVSCINEFKNIDKFVFDTELQTLTPR